MNSFLGLAFFASLSLMLQNGIMGEVTHEDIRGAILSLANLFRNHAEKLERHEYRERQLGEQLKKALAGLDKRHKNQEQHTERTETLISELVGRMNRMENLIKRDEEEKSSMLECKDELQEVKAMISKLLKEVGGSTKGVTTSYTVQGSDKEYIETLETALSSRIENLTSAVENLQAPAGKSSHSCSNDKWLLHFEQQESILRKLTVLLQETMENMNRLPSRLEIEEMTNGTYDSLQEMKMNLISIGDQGVEKLMLRLDEGISQSGLHHKDFIKIMEDLQSGSENLYEDITKSYEQLIKEMKGLSKVEEVMVQTADNLLDTRRRVEYGVHQILLEVGDLIKLQGKDLKDTVDRRFDDIEATILDNQTGALTNLSSKIETEISQVWRQIGIMYQQLTASADTLDRLQEKTDAYVNGSAKTMDSMEGNVEMITKRMSEVDDNLNYLLGKLSLVTSEFNQIKAGLASALDNIRNSFLEVQNQIKDVGPGPIEIKSENQPSP